jgi:phytoene dehydrogenase-like protein
MLKQPYNSGMLHCCHMTCHMQDKELQALLAGQYVDIGLPPGRSSAAYQLLVMQHYLEGGYVPIGGASSIAAAMIPVIAEAGGAVVTSADVQQVLVRDGKAAGVRLAGGQEINSNVVSNVPFKECVSTVYVFKP